MGKTSVLVIPQHPPSLMPGRATTGRSQVLHAYYPASTHVLLLFWNKDDGQEPPTAEEPTQTGSGIFQSCSGVLPA